MSDQAEFPHHHYIPVFYLKQWAPGGRFIEFSRQHGGVVKGRPTSPAGEPQRHLSARHHRHLPADGLISPPTAICVLVSLRRLGITLSRLGAARISERTGQI